jgi:hypothetical protein
VHRVLRCGRQAAVHSARQGVEPAGRCSEGSRGAPCSDSYRWSPARRQNRLTARYNRWRPAGRLERCGHVNGHKLHNVTIPALLAEFYAAVEVKPGAATTYRQTEQNLSDHFANEVRARDIGPLEAAKWRQSIRTQALPSNDRQPLRKGGAESGAAALRRRSQSVAGASRRNAESPGVSGGF